MENCRIIHIRDPNSLRLHLAGQRRRRAVITAHGVAMLVKIARKGTHPYAADTQKKEILYVLRRNHDFLSRNLGTKVQKNFDICKKKRTFAAEK